MNIVARINRYFIPKSILPDEFLAYKYRLTLNASISTSLFSFVYLLISLLISFKEGVYLMVFNVSGFLLIPFLMRWNAPIRLLSNLYVFIGSTAVGILIYYSGGIQSPIFPWLIAPPVLALLIVNKHYALMWTGVSLALLIVFTAMVKYGYTFPVSYNTDWSLFFAFLCSSGIIMIIVMIAMIFESNTTEALVTLESRKKELEKSKQELSIQHAEILEKNEELQAQKEEITLISEQLKELNEKKDSLMYIIAHDLKSPLANIQALIWLSKMRDKSLDLTDQQVIAMIGDITQKSQGLIQKLLNTENFEQIAYNLKLEELDISTVAREVIQDLKNQAGKKNLSIQIVIEENKDFKALVDKIYLTQVFENLLNNAIKFSPQDKQIEVSVQAFDKTLRVIFKDDGPGIKEEEKDKLFKKFSKLSNKPTAGESSSGLGLSIVKHYTELLNGKCGVRVSMVRGVVLW